MPSIPASRWPELEVAITLLGVHEGRRWRITAPLLKLSLKYGAVGPWHAFNRSVAFDAVAHTSGPERGLPGLAEMAATQLMGSGVNGGHLPYFLRWLAAPDAVAGLERLRADLLSSEGLHDLPDDALGRLAAFADAMIADDERLPLFKMARVFKWLSAWAPRHVPMVDSAVHAAVTGYYPEERAHDSLTVLTRYREVLREHLPSLRVIAERFHAEHPGLLPCTLSAVRVLDNLYWFDWIAAYDDDFRSYVRPVEPEDGDCHEVLQG